MWRLGVFVVVIATAFALPTTHTGRQVRVDKYFQSNNILLVQATSAKQKTGTFSIPSLSGSLVVTLKDSEWWDAAAAREFAERECNGPEKACLSSQLSELIRAGTANCTECTDGQFEAAECGTESDRKCEKCSEPRDEMYIAQACSRTADAVLANCTEPCVNGTYQSVACTATTDRKCAQCSERGSNQYIAEPCVPETDDSPAHMGHDATLTACTECTEGVSFEIGECGANDGTSNRQCQLCDACPSDAYRLYPCTLTSNTHCSNCSQCEAGYTFMSVACGVENDTLCSECTVCKDNEFMISDCTPTQDRVCKKCSRCGAGEYETAPCWNTTDTECAPCKPECEDGTYQIAKCDDFQNTKCAQCATCEAGKYVTEECGKWSNTKCEPCAVCEEGKFASGGCEGTNNTQCETCSSCDIGQVAQTTCSASHDTVCRDCQFLANAQFLTRGSCDFKCIVGHHKSKDGSSCYACTQCSDSQYEAWPCSQDMDTVCKVRGAIELLHYLSNEDSHSPGHINLSRLRFTFKNPVALIAPPSINDKTACVPRVSKVESPLGYKVWLADAAEQGNTKAKPHGYEYSSYLVLDEGMGSNYFVGTIDVSGEDGFVTVPLPDSPALGLRPWIFTTVQSSNNLDAPINGFVKPRLSLSENSRTSFQLLLEADAAHRNQASNETVGYLAINSGCAQTQAEGDKSNLAVYCPTQLGKLSIDGQEWDYLLGVTETIATATAGAEDVQSVTFGTTFKSTPVVFASIQTSRSSLAVALRTRDISEEAFHFVLQSDLSLGPREPHTPEWVAWLAVGVFADRSTL